MKIKIVVDANVILSALLGGKALFILFRKEFKFLTTENTLEEVEKYFPLVEKKSGVSTKEIKEHLGLFPIKIYAKEYYQKMVPKAQKLIQTIDHKDIGILALALKENTFLWSQDKHFEKIGNIVKILKTKDLL